MTTRTATFAAGCFWGVEHSFRQVPGVIETTVGYEGGKLDKPSYEDVCSHTTGHAEVVKVKYDSAKVSFEQLLAVFWHAHDPTQLNRQGPDIGDQYRSAIFYADDAQRQAAVKSMEREQATGPYSKPIVTQIVPSGMFWKAEDYHQQYIAKHPDWPCHLLDRPLPTILASAPAPGSPGAVADKVEHATTLSTVSGAACALNGSAACGAEFWKSKTDEEWRKILTPEQYRVAREAGTERPFTGKYWNTHLPGTYACAACGQELFSSQAKFDSGTGWPSFFQPITAGVVADHEDDTLGMKRVEVTCSRCGAHLGHVFDDGPRPTGLRYCINSAVLNLVLKDKEAMLAK